MIDYQYPVSRDDIREREYLASALSAFAAEEDANISTLIRHIGEALHRDAVRLNLDDDIANVCEFAKRVGSELLSDELRSEHFEGKVWRMRPRDEVFLQFKTDRSNADRSVLLPPDVRNIASTLHFFVTLHWDPEYKETARRVAQFITDNGLWSYIETNRAYELRIFRQSR